MDDAVDFRGVDNGLCGDSLGTDNERNGTENQ
jgi:hypothetical protein